MNNEWNVQICDKDESIDGISNLCDLLQQLRELRLYYRKNPMEAFHMPDNIGTLHDFVEKDDWICGIATIREDLIEDSFSHMEEGAPVYAYCDKNKDLKELLRQDYEEGEHHFHISINGSLREGKLEEMKAAVIYL